MRRGDSGSEATRSTGKVAGGEIQDITAERDEYGQERQTGAAQGKGLIQLQIAAGGDLLGHGPQPRGSELPPIKAVVQRRGSRRNTILAGAVRTGWSRIA